MKVRKGLNRDDFTEDPSDDDLRELGHDGGTDTCICTHCGADVFEDADQCPRCGMYLVGGRGCGQGASLRTCPTWIVVTAVAVALALVASLGIAVLRALR